jgi:hypothetical protein
MLLLIHFLVSSLEHSTGGIGKCLVNLLAMILYGLRPIPQYNDMVVKIKHRLLPTEDHNA